MSNAQPCRRKAFAASYITTAARSGRQNEGMEQLGPLWQVVIRSGRPVWRVCCNDICVEEDSGAAALAALTAMMASHGLGSPPEIGPSLFS